MLFSGLDPTTLVSLVIAVVVAISVHEFAHAVAADLLGDPTPRQQGRLTLDPRRHLEPWGSIMLLLGGFGWGRPVYTNPHYYRCDARTGMAIVAIAGPLSNLALAMLASFPIRLQLVSQPILAYGVWIFVSTNIALLVFNLIPISPLDGFKIAVGFLPDSWACMLLRLEARGPMILMMLVIMPRLIGFDLIGMLMGPPHGVIMDMLHGA